METNTNKSIAAAMALMENRRQVKALKEYEKELRRGFATTILEDAIHQPSRVLRLDKYWRTTGLLAMEVESMVVNLIDHTDNPAYSGLHTMHTAIRRKYAEVDEDGNPTGKFFERTEECAIIINLGAVQVLDGETREVNLGAASLIDQSPMCTPNTCYYTRKGTTCPDGERKVKWKCPSNYGHAQKLIDRILNNQK